MVGVLIPFYGRASYKMFTGVKMRKNGDWYAFYGKETAGMSVYDS